MIFITFHASLAVLRAEPRVLTSSGSESSSEQRAAFTCLRSEERGVILGQLSHLAEVHGEDQAPEHSRAVLGLWM